MRVRNVSLETRRVAEHVGINYRGLNPPRGILKVQNKPPRPDRPRFLFRENGLITPPIHPWIKNPRFSGSLNKTSID